MRMNAGRTHRRLHSFFRMHCAMLGPWLDYCSTYRKSGKSPLFPPCATQFLSFRSFLSGRKFNQLSRTKERIVESTSVFSWFSIDYSSVRRASTAVSRLSKVNPPDFQSPFSRCQFGEYGVGQAFPATLSHSDWLSHLVIIPLNTWKYSVFP